MSHKAISIINRLMVVGIASLIVSVSALAQEQDRSEVIERIKPIGQVTVEGQAPAEGQAEAAPASDASETAPVAAAEPAKPADPGAELYQTKGCTACHGPEGRTPIMSSYPKLAALPEQYIFNQLKDIKSGARDNGQTAAMKGIMASVSEEDMQVLAGWLSGLPRKADAAAEKTAESAPEPQTASEPAAAAPAAAPAETAEAAKAQPAPAPVPTTPAVTKTADGSAGESLYASKGCVACHGPEGKSPIMTSYPKVAGLPAPYIVNQMKDIKSGARANGQSAVMKGIMAGVTEEDMQAIADWLSKLSMSK